MPFFLLTPLLPEDEIWAASKQRTPVQVFAQDESQARHFAAREFMSVSDIGIKGNPWQRRDFVHVAPIESVSTAIPLLRAGALDGKRGRKPGHKARRQSAAVRLQGGRHALEIKYAARLQSGTSQFTLYIAQRSCELWSAFVRESMPTGASRYAATMRHDSLESLKQLIRVHAERFGGPLESDSLRLLRELGKRETA